MNYVTSVITKGSTKMISLIMFASLWVSTVKDLSASKYMNYVFVAFLIITAIFKIPTPYLLPLAAIFVGIGIYAIFARWPEYPIKKTIRPKKKWIKYPTETIAYRSFLWILKILPLPVLSWLGGKLLETFGPMTRRQQTAQKNLAMIMPENNNPEFIKKMWNNWGRVFAEGIKFRTYRKKMAKYITFENKDLFDNSGQVLLALPHLGYMGIMALSFIGSNKTISITYKYPSNPLSNDIILGNYGLGQVKEVEFIPTGNAFPLIRAIKRGDTININSDQRTSVGEMIDFMGQPAKTSLGLTQLACKFNLPVLVAHVERTHGAHHKIVFDEFVHMPNTGDTHADEINGMQLVSNAMSRAIMKSPAEYLWVHRRWMS